MDWSKGLKVLAALAAVVVLIIAVTAVGNRSDRQTDTKLYNFQVAASDVLYHTQLESCGRGNDLRAENNVRAKNNQIQLGVLRKFLVGARDARQASYDRDGHAEDKLAAEEYQHGINQISHLKYTVVPLVDCNEVIPKPHLPDRP